MSELYVEEEGRLAVETRPETGRLGREKGEGVTLGITVGVSSSDAEESVSITC